MQNYRNLLIAVAAAVLIALAAFLIMGNEQATTPATTPPAGTPPADTSTK